MPDSRTIIKSRIDATSYEDACHRVQTWAESDTSCYIIAANVHVVMTDYWQSDYQEIINQAALVTPDGMPLVIGMRMLGIEKQSRVYGPDLMLAYCDRASHTHTPIYLYGGSETTLNKLQHSLQARFPGLNIAGSHSPPFRPLTPAEEADDIQRIHASGAKVVFVGLGCPKQEQWMQRQQGKLRAVMIGVGAAFSFHSGEVSQAPRWMMKLGLEWLYRLIQEPQRLWKRYLINNPFFLVLFGLQWVRYRLKSIFSKARKAGN
jgi:N-acetylglucosaminyldiphosphoundecaprenol N-acetyl-beta-D-mannosaminyltransferase